MNPENITSQQTTGWRIQVAKVAWLVLVVFNLTLYILGSVIYLRELSTLCEDTRRECHDRSRVTPEDMARLEADGIGLEDWGLWNIAYRTLIAAVFCAVGFLIFARRRNERNGLL